MDDREVLIAARARIENPQHWTTHAWARDEKGREVDPHDPTCTAWCMGGALVWAVGTAGMRPADKAVYLDMPVRRVLAGTCARLLQEMPEGSGFADVAALAITHLNDLGHHDLVMKAFDGAIEEVTSPP